jgi:hypothetical protein
MGERVKGKYGQGKYGRAEILAGTSRRGDFIGWCGGESNGIKLGGGKQAAATSGEAYRAS